MNLMTISHCKITGLNEYEKYLEEKFQSDIKACKQNIMLLIIGIPLLTLIGIIVCNLDALCLFIVSITFMFPVYICYYMYISTKEYFYKSLDEINYLKSTPLKDVKYSYINSKLSIVYNDNFSSNIIRTLEITDDENIIDYKRKTLKLKINE